MPKSINWSPTITNNQGQPKINVYIYLIPEKKKKIVDFFLFSFFFSTYNIISIFLNAHLSGNFIKL